MKLNNAFRSDREVRQCLRRYVLCILRYRTLIVNVRRTLTRTSKKFVVPKVHSYPKFEPNPKAKRKTVVNPNIKMCRISKVPNPTFSFVRFHARKPRISTEIMGRNSEIFSLSAGHLISFRSSAEKSKLLAHSHQGYGLQ